MTVSFWFAGDNSERRSLSASPFFGCHRQTRAWWHKKRKTYNRTVAGIKIVGPLALGSKGESKWRLRMMFSYRVILRVFFIILVAWAGWSTLSPGASGQSVSQKETAVPATREAGLAAWQQVYSVLTHPRCISCHTATNYPQQGDDRHRHLFNVVRGPGDKGVPGLNCATCHQGANADSTGVPGAHDWHLAPLSMKWQDINDKILSSPEICRSLTDRSKNHSPDGLLKHHQVEPLVLWAFQPGRSRDGTARAQPPLTHDEFVAATRAWVEAGTPCPKNP